MKQGCGKTLRVKARMTNTPWEADHAMDATRKALSDLGRSLAKLWQLGLRCLMQEIASSG